MVEGGSTSDFSRLSSLSPEAVKQNDRHRMLYKTPPRSRPNHRKKCMELIASKRKERQALLVENFRRLNTGEDCADRKQAIVQETMASMLKQFNIDFNEHSGNEDEEYQRFLTEFQQELMNDYDAMIIEQREEELLDDEIDLVDSVTCFACQKASMSFEYDDVRTRITCTKCSFTMFIGGHLFAGHLNDRMSDIMAQHRSNCGCPFHFEPVGEFHQCENLKVLCRNCNFNILFFQ